MLKNGIKHTKYGIKMPEHGFFTILLVQRVLNSQNSEKKKEILSDFVYKVPKYLQTLKYAQILMANAFTCR